MGVNNYPFWWGVLFSGTFFGNLTLIGSTANIVAIGMLEEKGYVKGGSWKCETEHVLMCDNNLHLTSLEPSPRVGFRVFMEIVQK